MINYTDTPPFENGDIIQYNVEVADPGNNFNTSTYEFTAPYDGFFFVNLRAFLEYDFPIQVEGVAELQLFESGSATQIAGSSFEFSSPYSGSNDLRINGRFNFTRNEKYYAVLNVNVISKSDTDAFSITIDKDNSYFRIPKAASIFDNSTVIMANQFDSQTKSLDLFKGFLEHFNLVAYPDTNSNKVLVIEQFETWIVTGKLICHNNSRVIKY